MTEQLNTHNVRIPFGKHKDELFTRLPRSYLRWLANEQKMESQWKTLAKSELDRRGTTMPTLEISGHAVDRASLRCRKIWHESRGEEEGIHSWLQRMAMEARKTEPVRDGVYRHAGMQFIFEEGDEFPALKTVMPK